jgi:hypothetical protein
MNEGMWDSTMFDLAEDAIEELTSEPWELSSRHLVENGIEENVDHNGIAEPGDDDAETGDDKIILSSAAGDGLLGISKSERKA